MNQYNSTYIPKDLRTVFTKNIKSPLYCVETYRAIIEYLRWITTTQYDMKYVLGCCSKYIAESQVAHMLVAKCILKYLKRTIDYGILFPSDNLERFVTYANADYARDRDTHRSLRRIIYNIGQAPIAASNKLQPTVSTSTAEIEYRVASDTMSNVKYLKHLL